MTLVHAAPELLLWPGPNPPPEPGACLLPMRHSSPAPWRRSDASQLLEPRPVDNQTKYACHILCTSRWIKKEREERKTKTEKDTGEKVGVGHSITPYTSPRYAAWFTVCNIPLASSVCAYVIQELEV